MKTFKNIADQLNCDLVEIRYHNFGHTAKGYDIVNKYGYILYSFIPYNDSKANIWKVIRKTPDDFRNIQPVVFYGSAREVVARKDMFYASMRTSYKLSGQFEMLPVSTP